MKKNEVKLEITLDENNIPEKIIWNAEGEKIMQETKAAFLSVWDEKENISLSLDLWTKSMTAHEMKVFFFQMLNNMSNSLERATGESSVAQDMRDFALYFGEKLEVISKNSNQ